MEFTHEQIAEARDYLRSNLGSWIADISDEAKLELIALYFKLKQVKFELEPNQFVISLDYKDMDKTKTGEESAKISLHDPKSKPATDPFAKDILVRLLKTLVKPK